MQDQVRGEIASISLHGAILGQCTGPQLDEEYVQRTVGTGRRGHVYELAGIPAFLDGSDETKGTRGGDRTTIHDKTDKR